MFQNGVEKFKLGRLMLGVVAMVVIIILSVPALAQEATEEGSTLPNIVLVHGAWADGSSWSAVTEILQAQGYNVIAPQFPLTTVEADVARLQQALARLSGPTILAGHSYGGEIITALGATDPDVVGLVYVAAFGLDEGESIGALLQGGPPTPALANLQVDELGFGWLPQDDFVNHFAADVDPVKSNAMWAAQQPGSLKLFEYVMGVPTWKSVPSWYVVAANDEAIPPDAQRLFAGRMGATTVELESSHVPMVSQPQAVADVIISAAQSVSAE